MHKSVLLKEVLEILNPQVGETMIDGTLGGGGHGLEIAKMISPDGRFLGVDQDAIRIEEARGRFKEDGVKLSKFVVTQGNYADLPEIMEQIGFDMADGLLVDLGFSSDQLVEGRGFAFKGSEEPLKMTYNENDYPLYQVLPTLSEKTVEMIIKDLSDERYARRIAKAIKFSEKRILTNKDLAEVVRRALPSNYEHGRIDPATRTFMAFRIYINRELENLGRLLGELEKIIKPEGRVVIISFHSKEDEMVKAVFKDLVAEGKAEFITKDVVRASETEIQDNPRSRSAKLRAIKIK